MTDAYRFPAEWELQSAILIAWPHADTDWADRLAEVEETYVALVAAITRFQPVVVCVADDDLQTYAEARLVGGAVYPAVNGTWPTAYDYASVAFTAGPPDDGQLATLIVAAQIQFQIFENRGRDDQKFIDGMEAAVNSVLGTLRPVLV